jgi:hypothetical protein
VFAPVGSDEYRQIGQPLRGRYPYDKLHTHDRETTSNPPKIRLSPVEPLGCSWMSTDANTGADVDGADDSTTDYQAMLDTLDIAIEEAQYKVENGRVRSPENEKVRIKWVRCLAYAVNVRRQVANDRDLEELADQVQELKEMHEGDV